MPLSFSVSFVPGQKISFNVYTKGCILSTLHIRFHPDADDELDDLLDSPDARERRAGEQILILLQIVESNAQLRDRLLAHNETIYTRQNGIVRRVDIKVIRALEEIAEDKKYLTDAVRRIRDLTEKPVDEYRVFFEPVTMSGNSHVVRVLGIIHRDHAYSAQTLQIIKSRFEK